MSYSKSVKKSINRHNAKLAQWLKESDECFIITKVDYQYIDTYIKLNSDILFWSGFYSLNYIYLEMIDGDYP
jgi:hypothetical protein